MNLPAGQSAPLPRLTRALALPALLLLGGMAGCGTSPAPVRWQDAMEDWFSNSSVNPEEPPRLLWTRKDEDLFLRRIGYADVVAVGTIRLVAIFASFEAPSQLAAAFRPSEVLHGEMKEHLDPNGELQLQLRPSDLDFQTALQVRARLPGQRFVLLLKLKPDDPGGQQKRSPVLRWALYRPDTRLLAEIRAMYQWLERKDEKPPEDDKDSEDSKDSTGGKGGKDSKDSTGGKDSKDSTGGKDSRGGKGSRDSEDSKDGTGN